MTTRRRNPPRGSAAPSDPDELSALSGATTQASGANAQASGATAQGNEALSGPGSATLGSPGPEPTPAPEPAPAITYSEADLQRLLRICMGAKEAPPEPRERPLKARFPDLYYRKSHMDCYHFCQQC